MTWESISQGFQEEMGIEKFSNLKRLSVHDSLHHQHQVMLCKCAQFLRDQKHIYAVFTLKLFEWLPSPSGMAATCESYAARE
jgi:hypothetical protein